MLFIITGIKFAILSTNCSVFMTDQRLLMLQDASNFFCKILLKSLIKLFW